MSSRDRWRRAARADSPVSNKARGSSDWRIMLKSVRDVKGNRRRYRRVLGSLLHNSMAAALTNSDESILFEDSANLRPRKNPKLTQLEPEPRLA
jgi:hypothetical protein